MKRAVSCSVYDQPASYTWFKTFTVSSLRPVTLRAVASIFFNFFFRQYRAALLPGRVPVSKVDHPLDLKIPFTPAWVAVYLDFVNFWIRMLSFLFRSYGRGAYDAVRDFVRSMGELYAFAARSYQKNFSTTERPFYIARPRFFLIHLLDPHLMCIPSLHVMVVIRTWTKFAAILRSMGEAERCAAQIAEMKQGALAITQAVLFVKQHSVNCISAALYAMTCFDRELFPPEEAEAFTALLFEAQSGPAPVHGSSRVHPASAPRTVLPAADAAEIKSHIIGLYRQFLAEGERCQNWEAPLLHFMRSCVCPPALRGRATQGGKANL